MHCRKKKIKEKIVRCELGQLNSVKENSEINRLVYLMSTGVSYLGQFLKVKTDTNA